MLDFRSGERISSLNFLLAFIIGALAVWLSTLKPTWAFLAVGFCAVLSLMPVLVYSRINLPFFFLCIYALFMPLDMSKAFTFHFGDEEAIKYLSLQDIISFFMIACWLFEVFTSKVREKIHFSNILLPFFLFVLWSELSMVNAIKPHLTLFNITTYLKWFLVLVSISNMMRTKRHFEILLVCLALSVLSQGVYVLLQMKFHSMMALAGQKTTTLGRGLSFGTGFQQVLRPSGTFQHPNVLGSYMVYCLPMFFVITLLKRPLLFKIPFYITMVAGLLCLLMSFSRGSWIGFTLAMAILLAIAAKKGWVKGKNLAILCLLSIVMAGAFFPMWKPLLWRLTRPDDSSSITRLMMLKQAYLMVKAHPFLGIGLGNYAEAGKNYIPDWSNLIRFAPKGYIAHNRYAVVVAETGLVGLSLFLWLVWRVVAQARKNIDIKDHDMQFISLALFSSLLGILLAMMFDHFSDNTRSIMFWFFTALIVAIKFHFLDNRLRERAP